VGFSTKHIADAPKSIAEVLKYKNGFHLVGIRSIVLPGTKENIAKPLIENISGGKCGEGFGLCYNPELLALGRFVKDFLNPDVVLIGESDPRSGELLSQIYHQVCDNGPPIVGTTTSNAELLGCWRILDRSEFDKKLEYMAIGLGRGY